jgi:hypothetical protein
MSRLKELNNKDYYGCCHSCNVKISIKKNNKEGGTHIYLPVKDFVIHGKDLIIIPES